MADLNLYRVLKEFQDDIKLTINKIEIKQIELEAKINKVLTNTEVKTI